MGAVHFEGTEKIGDIVAEFSGASHIFKAYHIDFCCGGNLPLRQVITESGKNEGEILTQLNAAYEEHLANANDTSIDWREESSTALIDHIVGTHHAYLQKELPVLSEFVTKIFRVHGATHGDVLSKLHRLFHTMKMELEHHLMAEENNVFPLIEKYEQDQLQETKEKAAQAIVDAEDEHDEVGNILKEMRKITDNYQLPEDACATYMLTFQKLEELESDIFQHVHLENNILFPRTA